MGIQKRANIGPPAKRHLNGVSLVGRKWPEMTSRLCIYLVVCEKVTLFKTGYILGYRDNGTSLEILVLITSASREGSDEPALVHCLVIALASRIHKVWNGGGRLNSF